LKDDIMQIEIRGSSDVGKKRSHNEDSFFFSQENNFIVVADGVGGEKAGEVASRIAVETIKSFLQEDNSKDIEKLLQDSLNKAHEKIISHSQEHLECKGMSTTTNVLFFKENKAIIANVGDSRTYLIKKSSITQITIDQTLAQEIKNKKIDVDLSKISIQSGALVSALGFEKMQVDLYKKDLHSGDIYLSASDGLFDMVSDSDILKIVLENPDLQTMVKELIAQANDNGGKDNITVVIARLI
jgi:PPM family protein phosphatase